jgi:squalene monooxygenase
LEDWDRVGEGLREWFWRRKSLAGVVNVLSMALYDLFGGADGEWTGTCLAESLESAQKHIDWEECGGGTWAALMDAEPDLEILREGCFRYFELGGECIAGPVGLLSA